MSKRVNVCWVSIGDACSTLAITVPIKSICIVRVGSGSSGDVVMLVGWTSEGSCVYRTNQYLRYGFGLPGPSHAHFQLHITTANLGTTSQCLSEVK
jgi:hypothetical protein